MTGAADAADAPALGPTAGLDRRGRDREYSPSSLVPGYEAVVRAYGERSERARASLRWEELAYGPGPAERVHYFPGPGLRPPLHVFVHGGYWQELSAAESSFAAPGFVGRGAAFAALGYGLAPAHTLDEIVDAVRRGVLWLFGQAGRLGVDTGGVYLSGMSAGAHLVATCLGPSWLPAGLRVPDVVRGVALLSGLYELEPLRHTYVGDAIGLTAGQVARHSPARHAHPALPPVILARGDDETRAFAWQQDVYVAALRARAVPAVDLVARGRHHFDLPFDLPDPATPLGRAVLAQMGL